MADSFAEEIKIFDTRVKKHCGRPLEDNEIPHDLPSLLHLDEDEDGYDTDEHEEPEALLPEDNYEEYDKFLSAEVVLPFKGNKLLGKVIARKRDHTGAPIGTANASPLLDTRVYDVQLPDGNVEEFTANEIACNIYADMDEEGHEFRLMDGIVDHRRVDTDTDIAAHSKLDISTKGCDIKSSVRPDLPDNKSTKGWELLIQWKDGSSSWERLSDLKECMPVDTADYAFAHGLEKETAFSWWVTFVNKTRNRIIKKIKTRFWKKTHKFGIRIPRSIKDALEIDRLNGNDYWS